MALCLGRFSGPEWTKLGIRRLHCRATVAVDLVDPSDRENLELGVIYVRLPPDHDTLYERFYRLNWESIGVRRLD